MDIKITKGTGEGNTDIGAFDTALNNAGISNYNLIYLSSIIPDNCKIVLEKPTPRPDEFGYRLYVVMAQQRESEAGKEAWAGIGWTVAKNGNGRGLFVEHHGGSKEEIENLINGSLTQMIAMRGEEYGPIQSEIAGIKSEGKPVCALVSAVYKSENWQ